MTHSTALHFIFRDRVNSIDVGPQYVPLDYLGEFQKDVADFLRGSTRDVDTAKIAISIESGSLQFAATGIPKTATLWSDLRALQSPNSLHRIDPRRAEMLVFWQEESRKSPHRVYLLQDPASSLKIVVDSTTNFTPPDDTWVTVEKYVEGTILSWGGKGRATIRIERADGRLLVVEASKEMLQQEVENRLYKTATLNISVEENLRTGELKNPKLKAFVPSPSAYDEAEFQKMVDKGTRAWADVPDITEWLENLRGGVR